MLMLVWLLAIALLLATVFVDEVGLEPLLLILDATVEAAFLLALDNLAISFSLN
jgi:hypothetical protein